MNTLYHFDRTLRQRGFRYIAGVDEAGRGSLAGPVVAASVILPEDFLIEQINDSKLLKPETREAIFAQIRTNALAVGVGIVRASEIDSMNIYNATVQAMLLSLKRLKIKPDLVVVDAMRLPIPLQQLSVIKADSQSASVAAASVVAKVVRDRIMKAIHCRYPQYGFNRHKGYATKEHLRVLQDQGPCPEHRRSFSPVRQTTIVWE